MPIDVLTNRYSNSRTGVNSDETRLTKQRVSSSTFGKLFARTVDDDLYAQPLIVSNLEIGEQGRKLGPNRRAYARAGIWPDTSAVIAIVALGDVVKAQLVGPQLGRNEAELGPEGREQAGVERCDGARSTAAWQTISALTAGWMMWRTLT
jgi:hypothetical protein